MSQKPSTARADLLRIMREQRYGHLQANAEDMMKRVMEGRKPGEPPKKKLIPYAGKESVGIAPDKRDGPRAEARKARDVAAREERKKLRDAANKIKRRTALPKDSER